MIKSKRIYCRRCGKSHLPDKQHTCPPQWEVILADEDNIPQGTFDAGIDGSNFFSSTPEEAAEFFVMLHDDDLEDGNLYHLLVIPYEKIIINGQSKKTWPSGHYYCILVKVSVSVHLQSTHIDLQQYQQPSLFIENQP